MNWLISLIMPFVGTIVFRALAALGIGVVSYAFLNGAATTVVDSMTANYGALPASISSLLNLSGFGTALSTIASAFVSRASLMAIKRFIPV